MFNFSEEKIDELLLWLSVNHDHVERTRTPPTRRMQAALLHSLQNCLEGLEVEELVPEMLELSPRRDD